MYRIRFSLSGAIVLLIVGCMQAEVGPDTSLITSVSTENYIVVLKKDPVRAAAKSSGLRVNSKKLIHDLMNALSENYGLPEASQVFSVALQGGVYKLDALQAKNLAQDQRVAYVEKDQIVKINSVQSNVTWGLDRIDQVNLPLNQTYNYSTSGAQVNAYVIDTGILISHEDFQGRASKGIDLVNVGGDAVDCNGHGTHVAGTIGSATYGVAKNVKLYAVRVLDCGGSGSYSNVIAGIEWVTANHVKPAVANMSLGGPISQAVDDAIAASIQAGVAYVVAAGNDNEPACNTSPSRLGPAITVGSSTSADARSSFSNYGTCVDLFGPGSDIKSLWYSSNSATNTISGTSMASPHVAGVAALYLAAHPNALPAEVQSALVNGSLQARLTNPGAGSPNRLVNTLFIEGGDGEDPPPPPVQDPTLSNGVTVSNLADFVGGEKYFTFEVPANSSNLVIEILDGSGDADLYVKRNERPTSSNYDCRPYKNGNVESCIVVAPASGVFHLMIKAYSAYSGLSLRASYQVGPQQPSAPCTDCSRSSGELSGKGALEYQGEYESAAGTHQYWLRGPVSGADFDLYLYKKNGSLWSEVASAVKASSSEEINYSGGEGIYRIKVISYSGAGKYDLWRKVP